MTLATYFYMLIILLPIEVVPCAMEYAYKQCHMILVAKDYFVKQTKGMNKVAFALC